MSDDWRCNHDPDSCARCKLFPACQQPYATEEEAWASVRATDPPIPFSESPPPRLYEKCEGSTHRFRDGATRCRCGRVGATLLNRPPAAPISTLPERPADEESNAAEFLRRMARVEEAKFTDPETGLYIPNGAPAKLDRIAAWIESQSSRLSSLERELDGVRNEREQWREAAESTLRLIDSAGARLDGMVRGASAARPAVLGDRSEAL